MNKAKKGYTKEKLCRDELIEQGWTIAFKSIRYRFGCIDFAKLFDVVAIRDNENFKTHPDWLFVSVKHFGKSNYYLSHQRDLKRFIKVYGLAGMTFQLWLWDKPRWAGRGKNKIWNIGGWKKITI